MIFDPLPPKRKLDFYKFVYSEKATKFCEIFTLLLSTVHTDKSKVEICNLVAFSEYMKFNRQFLKSYENLMQSRNKKKIVKSNSVQACSKLD